MRRLVPGEHDAAAGRRRLRLGTYFALMAGCFVVAAAAAAGYVELQTSRDARHGAERDARFAARTAATQLGSSVTVLRKTVADLAANPQIGQAIDKPAGCTLTFGLGGLGDGHLDIVRPDGAVVCSSRAPATGKPLWRYAGASWLGGALRRPALLTPIADPLTHRKVALATSPIPHGRGIVAGFVDLSPLAGQLAALYGAGKPFEFLLVDTRSGTVIGRSIRPGRSIGTDIAGTPFSRSSGATRPDLDGTRRFYATASVPATGWTLYVGEDAHAALASGRRLQRRELAIILIGLAGVLAAAFFVYRRTAHPIAALAAAVRETNPYATPPPVPTAGPAEVAALGDGINELVASVGTELGERRLAEEAQRSSEESYRALFEHHPAPMWLFDTEKLAFLAVNDAAIAAYGYTRDEFLAMTIEDIRPAEDRGALREAVAALGDAHVDAGVWRHRTKDGQLIDVVISSNPVDFLDRPARVVLARDVTAQRKLEEQLRQVQKMEAVGRLAGGIAHDFNNLLVVIKGHSALLTEALADDELRTHAAAIDDAGARAAALTRQLLAFSRQQVLRPRVVDLNAIVDDANHLLSRLIGEDIDLTVEHEDDLWAVLADAGQIGQVILNLAINARDAMPSGGRLTIKTANARLDANYADQHVDVVPGEYVLLQVTDSGTGMTKETRDRVFEPFFTTKGEGTGLGLATVHGIVRQSGGHIWLYSEPGIGTTFKVYLPRTDQRPSEPVPASQPDELGGDETILLVEDEPTVRDFVATVLERLGYRVLQADRAEAARSIAAAEHGIDLLITDIVMPGTNGRELAHDLQAGRPGLHVLFTSGYPADPLLHRLDDSRTGFLEKPFSASELARQIRELLQAEPVRAPAEPVQAPAEPAEHTDAT